MSEKDNNIVEQIYNHPMQYKQCSKCKELKPASEFNKTKRSKDGLQPVCKQCMKKYKKEYYQKNKERIKQTQKTPKIVLQSQNNFGLLNLINFGFKICSGCECVKHINEFPNDRKKKDGKHAQCKECLKIINRQKYLLHRDERLKKAKIYRDTHKDQIKESHTKWRLNNIDHIRKKNKEYYIENRDHYLKQSKKHREQNKEYYRNYNYNYYHTPKGKEIQLNSCHRRRMQKENTTDKDKLSLQQWQKILDNQDNKCPMCGRKFTDKLKPTRDHILPLILGGTHSSDNIQALCKSCNSKKKDSLDLGKIQSWGIDKE